MEFCAEPVTKLVPNLPFKDYCGAPGVNQSRLKLFDYEMGGCPALYRWASTSPDERPDTKALTDGRRYHHFILEPDSFAVLYALRTKAVEQELFEKAKEDKKCKAKEFSTKLKTYEEWASKREAAGQEIITDAESDILHRMRESLMLNDEVYCELGACKSSQLEVSGFAGYKFKRGPHEGKAFQLKARFDINPDSDALIDLKTARTASPRKFARQAFELGYDLQAGFYQDVANANGLKKERFGFLAQDKFPPYLCCIHWVTTWLGHGRLRYSTILSGLADAITQDRWPGYVSGELEPPSYAMEEIEAAA